MAEQNIRCPHCGTNIALTQALSAQIRDGIRREFEEKARERELTVQKREEDLARRAGEVETAKKALEAEVARKLAYEKTKLLEEAQKKAREEMSLKLKDLEEANASKAQKLAEAQKAELELRRKARELEDEKKAMELEVQRKLDAERDRIRQSTLEMFMEEHRLKDQEKDKRINDMLKTIEELKRKGEQGSMQAQGEVLELDLESVLKARFPIDVIEPVAKGVRGADIVQKVHTRNGQFCGTIVWESKRTKAWHDEWIPKLKDDQREIKAEVAVLVTETMPKGVSTFSYMDGVWVAGISFAPGLAEALRMGLAQVAQTKLSTVGKNEKMEAIYNYLTGSEFRQKVEGIVEAFNTMRADLEKEKSAMMRIWAKREKQLERVVTNTLRMYGDMQGIAGAALPEIKALELGAGENFEETD